MTFSKTIIALLTAGLIGLFSFGSAQAIQPAKSLSVEAGTLIQKVDHHGTCFIYKKDSYGHRYCYKYRYKVCKWKYDSYGTRYCYKWHWAYYYGKPRHYKKGYGSHDY